MAHAKQPDQETESALPVVDFRALFENAPGACLIVLADEPVFTLVAASDALLRLVSLTREELVGRGLFDLFPGDASDSSATGVANLRASFRRVMATRRPDRLPLERYDVQVTGAEREFAERYWSWQNTPVLAPDGNVQHILHTTEEVTEKVFIAQRERLAARERDISESRFRLLAESGAFAFFTGNVEGEVSYLNPQLRDLLGDAKEEVGRLARGAAKQLAASGRCIPYETACLAGSGRLVPVLVAPSLLATGTDRGEVACFVIDLTERKKSEQDAFLVRLDDATRPLVNPETIMQTTTRLLGDYLQVDRCTYCVFEADQDALDILWDYTQPGVPSMTGHYRLSQFGAAATRLLRANLPYVVDDVESEPDLADVVESFRQAFVAAQISVPLHKSSRLAAALAVHQRTPRRWLPEDLELVQLVANRCWESIERARVARALRESESRLRLAQQAGRIGSFEWLIQRNEVTWTAELELLYELPEGSFKGEFSDWAKQVLAEDADRVGAGIQACFAARESEYSYEFRAILPSGKTRWLLGLAQFFYDERGAPERMIGVNIDIDDQKRAEARLRESEQRLRAIFDGTYEYLGLLAPDGTVLEANRASLEFAGNSRENVHGRRFWEMPWFSHTPGASEMVQRLLARAATGEFVRFEVTVRRPDGENRTLDISFHPSLGEQGQVALIVPEGRDITERKAVEERLRQQFHNFDAVLTNIADFTYTFDLNGRITYANRALLSLWRRSLEDVVGKNFFEIDYPEPLASRLQDQIQTVIAQKSPVRAHTDFAGPTGEMRHYEYILVPVLADDGSVEAVAGSTRDVTERRAAEERERQREQQLRESARLESLGVMAGGIAHDFNNLLTGILGNASLLTEVVPDAESRQIASQVVLAAERAADLTNQMLAFSGKGTFAVDAVDLDSLVHENLTLLRASLAKNVTVDWDLGCGNCWIEADRSQMQQVVMNLLINASEAVGLKPGTVAIRTFLTTCREPRFSSQLQAIVAAGDFVTLEVRDNGSGMTPDTLRRIFDPFFTTKFTGRGLGLSAVLGIVKGHRGDIEVESELGSGTTFRVLLPIVENVRFEPEKRPSVTAAAVESQTILVVDDEELVRKTASLVLERRGHRVLQAANGMEAVDMVRSHAEIALVILDLTMPVMTGEQAIPLIKQIRSALPILLSSGFSEPEVTRRFASAGISGCLQKPYRVATLSSRVTEVLAGAARMQI